MKKITLTILAIVVVAIAFSQQLALNTTKADGNIFDKAVITLKTKSHDFGKIKVGVPVDHEFTFTNTGTTPLIISSVQASCGCTVASYSKDPVAPGAQGFVKATYNAAKVGPFSKTVTVNSNTEEGSIVLTIKGEVTE